MQCDWKITAFPDGSGGIATARFERGAWYERDRWVGVGYARARTLASICMLSIDSRLLRFALVLAHVVLLAAAGPARAQRATTREYELKAEFIERFTHFIEWPAEAFADDNKPFVLCIAGQNPFGTYLDTLVGERRIQNRKAVLRTVTDADGATGCHVLFLANVARTKSAPLIASATRRPILTIGDGLPPAEPSVLVNFYPEGARVRFEVNLRAVKTSGLKFSSRLLKLARLVGTEAVP